MGRGSGGFPRGMGGMMGGGGNNMQQMLMKAQKMQEKIQATQAEIEAKEFDGTAGGDMVKATVNGKMEILKISIDPKAVDPDDVEMLEDLVLAAIKGAQEAAAKTMEEEMGKATGGMNMGGLF